MQADPPTQRWPTGQHWQGHGLVPLAQVMGTQRFIEQYSLQAQPPTQPALEQKYRVASIGSRAHASPALQPPMHVPPQPSETPHRTPGGHSGTQSHRRVVVLQSDPDGHCVPCPHAGPPGHTLGTSMPHGTRLGSVMHAGTHAQVPAVQGEPLGHALPHAPQWLFSA